MLEKIPYKEFSPVSHSVIMEKLLNKILLVKSFVVLRANNMSQNLLFCYNILHSK